MALWDALTPVATVAQLVGADAAGLVSATLHAVRTVRRNRKECRSLARRVMMVGDLLQLVQQGSSETLRRPEVRKALDGLGDALRRAFELVESCQDRNSAYGFVMAGRQAEQFQDVQGEIDSYLIAFPMVSHIDVTIRLDRIYNMLLHPTDHPQQALHVVPGSPTSHVEPYNRNEGSDLGLLPLENSPSETYGLMNTKEKAIKKLWKALLASGDPNLIWLLPQQNIKACDKLKAAKKNFPSRKKVWIGGCSRVYKDNIGGFEVAIKTYPYDANGHAAHLDSEYEIHKKLQHKNIIKLLGHCIGHGEKFFIFEYMSNGSMNEFVFGAARHGVSINWMSRFHIMEGIAQGLHYLHTHEPCIVHKDLKPSNILLDSNMNAMISDFGISTICTGAYHDTCISGTYGYIAPEYLREGLLSPKFDVYAYGVIFLEIISGKKCISLHDEDYVTLTEHAWHLWATMRSTEILDPFLRNKDQITDITRCVQIALLCVQTDPADRPSMADVLLMLGSKMTVSSPEPPNWHQAYGR